MKEFITNVWPIFVIPYGPVVVWFLATRLWKIIGSFRRSRSKVADRFTEAKSDTLTIVTLIHGTFAPDADWTKPDSKLVRHLDLLFGGTAAYFCPQWSGANSFQARAAAAAKISDDIKRFGALFPSARLFVIGHSHGGNIALKALTPEIIDRVDGVICLATPILTARKRQFHPFTEMFFNWIGVVPSVFVSKLVEPYWGENPAAVLWVGLSLASWIAIKAARRRASRRDLSEQYSHIPKEKAIFMRASGDEATLGIGTANLLSLAVEKIAQAPFDAASRIVQLLEWLRAVLLSHKLITFPALAVLVALPFFGGPTTEGTDLFIFRGVLLPIDLAFIFVLLRGALLIMLVAWFFSFLLLIPMFLLIGVASLVVGTDLAFAAATSYVTAEVCPPGQWSVIQLPANQLPASQRPTYTPILQHSIIYESDDALNVIDEWLGRRLRGFEEFQA